jgi:hypothetical protein
MPEAADLEGGVVAYLKSDPVTAAATEGRIFGGELPASETASMPRTALVVRASGGISLTGESKLEHDTQRLDVFAFGATPRAATAVMRAAALALRRLDRSVHAGCLIHWANAASGSIAGREPVTEWPRQFQSFQVMHGLLTIEE